ncbi:MAG TPA: DUF4129 domain-containing protein [Streptosporangiaceae bacterium]|jgi:hypothetical protein
MIAALLPTLVTLADAIGVGRDDARDAARRELGKRIYHSDDPTLVQRVIELLLGWIGELIALASRGLPGGWPAIIAVIVLITLAVVAVRLGVGPVRRTRARTPLLTAEPRTAADHRAAAESHAAAGDYAEAIAERLRAIAADLDDRAVVAARPGLTADELADQAARALPAFTARLRAAARLFDDVRYGDRPATAAAYATLASLDTDLQSARPTLAEATP